MKRPHDDSIQTRQAIIDACLWMNASGINQGTSGNISVRVPDGLVVTPSGIPYDRMSPDMLQTIPIEGDVAGGQTFKPTSEWRFHQSLMRARPDVSAIVHAHPAHATALAVQRRTIPACHYMVAVFGGTDVPLVDYALFGSEELARLVVEKMVDRHGCLMANHGALVVGETLEHALWRLEELENLARIYLLAQTNGAPHILSEAEMADVLAAISNYGPR